jgi:hypothetical protein
MKKFEKKKRTVNTLPLGVWSLLSQLFGQLSTTRLKDLLLWLKTQHIKDNSNHLKIHEIFNSYLTTAVAHPQFKQIFPELYLLSQTRQWKLPSQLVNRMTFRKPLLSSYLSIMRLIIPLIMLSLILARLLVFSVGIFQTYQILCVRFPK